jgi:cell division protein FtsA
MSQPQTQASPISDEQNIAVGLDLGTSKVCVIVASQSLNTKAINILGIGVAESYGMKRGVISNIEKTIQSIQTAVEQAEQQSGIKIKEVVVGIAGDHIESYQTRGIVGISNPNEEITKKDVERVLDECRHSNLPLERKILHIIPQEFIIDKQDGIYDPVGMSGVRMEAITHIVTGSSSAVRNIYKCIERLGIAIKDIILEPIASSYSVLLKMKKSWELL